MVKTKLGNFKDVFRAIMFLLKLRLKIIQEKQKFYNKCKKT